MSEKDTEWAPSSKGNQWRRLHGRVLIVGESEFGVWARVDDSYLEGPFKDLDDAMFATERSVESDLPRGEWW